LVWSGILADVLGVRIEQMEDPVSANSRGAAALALVALGVLDFREVEKMVRVKKVHEPDPGRQSIYRPKFDEFLNYFKQNRSWFERVNGTPGEEG
jgi:xylulokinase